LPAASEMQTVLPAEARSPEAAELAGMRVRPELVWIGALGLGLVILVRFGLTSRGVIEAATAAVLVVLSAIDLEKRVVPNRIVLPAAAVVLLAELAFYPGRSAEWLLASFGVALMLLLPLLAYPAGMGMGDVKLALLLGAALGRHVLGALMIAFVALLPLAAYLFVRHGSSARKSTFPFAPFLAFGSVCAMLLVGPSNF
jgi:leader peptidase (prepilin peptidase) / N-methyltransferase